MSECIFCKMMDGSIPAYTVYEDEEFKIILDRYPAILGHTLVIPKKHVADIFELDEETAGRLFKLAVKYAGIIKKAFNYPGMNILQNNGAVAGQSVHHFHMHLIPRHEKDNVTIKWATMDPAHEDFEKVLKVIQNAD